MNLAAGAALARVAPELPLVAGHAEAWAVLFAAQCCPRCVNVAKRLRTAPRRACSAVLLGFCRFCGFNGQLLKTDFALPTIGLSSQNCTLRGAAAAIKACKAVLLPTLDVVGRLPRRSGPRASARCDNVKTQIATGSKKLPRQRALEFLPLDALSQPRPAPWYQKPRASGRNLNRGRPHQ